MTTFPEARSCATEVKVEENSIMVSSAADRGFGGCEMWFNMETVNGLLGSSKIRMQHQHMSILVARQMRLIVLAQCETVTFYGMCVHALGSSAGVQADKRIRNRTG